MFSAIKKFMLIATLLTGLFSVSSLATSSVFYTGDDTGLVIVAISETQETTLSVDAKRLFDARDLIRLEYGAVSLNSLLRVKEIVAPAGITVQTPKLSLDQEPDGDELTLKFKVTNDAYSAGSFPVQIILENVETQETTAVNLMVQVQ